MPLPCAILLGVVIGVGLMCLLLASAPGRPPSMPVTPRPPTPLWRVPSGYQPQGDACPPPAIVTDQHTSVQPAATPHGPLPTRGSNGTKDP